MRLDPLDAQLRYSHRIPSGQSLARSDILIEMQLNLDDVLPGRLASLWRSWGREHWMVVGGVSLTLFFIWLAWPTADRAESAHAQVDRAATDTGAADSSELFALRAELRQEIDARQRLERDVSLLQARIEMLDAKAAGLELAGTPEGDEDEESAASGQRNAQRRSFDQGALLAGGVDPDEAESLRAAWEDLQMEKIYLNDQAAREGWAGTARHRQELRALNEGLREQLSLESYDRYLYATGGHNRARVVDVIDRSNGAAAGFAIGDRILSYDGQRVFNPDDLRKLAASGRSGESVRVEVARGKSTTTIDIPRGPIGLMLMPDREAPN